MDQLFSYLFRLFRNNENMLPCVPESIPINQYRRQCSYLKKNYKEYYKEFTDKFEVSIKDSFVYSNMVSLPIANRCIEKQTYAVIKARFMDNEVHNQYYDVNNGFLIDESSLKFEGPMLFSECEIYDLNVNKNIMEFGYIQTSKIFIERECEKGILSSDYQSNLLENQSEVLDIDPNIPIGEIIPYKPFYSDEGLYEVPDNVPPDNPIKLKLRDRPRSLPKLKFSCGSLKNQKLYLQFFVYLIMRFKLNYRDEWKTVVLYSFDWFIYSDWWRETHEHNNKYEYNYGINCHKTKRLLPAFDDRYICNRDQFQYWIYFDDLEIKVIKDPIFINEEGKQKFLENIKRAIQKRNNNEYKIK